MRNVHVRLLPGRPRASDGAVPVSVRYYLTADAREVTLYIYNRKIDQIATIPLKGGRAGWHTEKVWVPIRGEASQKRRAQGDVKQGAKRDDK